jgi:predicted ABC-type exoprotein transport system permease subunit
MELQLSTPALLFSAITLLMLAYTNRFLAIASLIRGLHKKFLDKPDQVFLVDQLQNLKKRLNMIKNMQLFGVLSFLLCVICMFFIYQGYTTAANVVFISSMVALLASLAISFVEIQISTRALNLELADMEEVFQKKSGSLGFIFKKDSKK